MIRLALLTEIPAPYRIPLFDALAAVEDFDLDVLFLADSDPRRPYDSDPASRRFRSQTLRGFDVQLRGTWLVLNVGVARALRGVRPDVVLVGGWNEPAFWTAAFRAKVPTIAWVESTLVDARPPSALTGVAKRAFARRCAGFVVPGRAAEAYVRSIATAAAPIVQAPNAVDTRTFRDRVAAARAVEPNGGRRVLYVGRLDQEKGLDTLLAAARRVEAEFVVVGDGREAAALRAAATANVVFTGWLEQEALVDHYAAADVFVLPSRSEPWGMVLNEAAAAGLPIVATTAAGAAAELVDDGRNGFRIAPDDPDALVAALTRVLDDPGLRTQAAQRSLELARAHEPAAWAAAVAALARDVAR